MDAFLVPADVRALLDGSAFRVTAPAGPDGTGWLAAATDGTDRRLEVHVVATVLDDVVAARAERLRLLQHEHLPRVHDVVEIGPGRTALVVEHVPGPTLAELRTQRAPLSDGEAATVAIPVASALGALHAAGLAHGAVSPATVVVGPEGRPALVDLRGVLVGTGTPDGDVRRLVATVLAQVPDADVHLLAAAPGPTLRDTLEDAVSTVALDADGLVSRCFAVAEPEPVRLPDAGARAALDVARHDAGAAVPAIRRRRRGARRRPGLLVAAGVAGVLVAGAVTVGLLHDRPGPATGTPARPDPVDAAVALTVRRAEVVATGDPTLLGQVEVVDGPAHRADAALVGALEGARLDGLVVDVAHAERVASTDSGADTGTGVGARAGAGADPGPAPSGPTTRSTAGPDVAVRVASAMSAHRRLPADGGAAVDVPATGTRTVVLVLRWTDDGWRVWDVVAA